MNPPECAYFDCLQAAVIGPIYHNYLKVYYFHCPPDMLED